MTEPSPAAGSSFAEPEHAELATRFRADLAYDGGGFSGWGAQPGLRTVQGVLEEALGSIFRRSPPSPRLVVAGRTDAGVHARAQVAHLDLSDVQLARLSMPSRRGLDAIHDPAEALLRRVNGILGLASDVVLHRVQRAPDGFDARFSAVWRRYEYRVADGVRRHDPAQRHRTLWHPVALNVDVMDAAAQSLVGLHDFGAFCKPREGATTVRTLQEFRWQRDAEGVLLATLQADAFCHSMVRALAGACVAVGEGKLSLQRLVEILADAGRGNDFIVLPAKGLTLTEVGYPPNAELAARAAQTRARRGDLETERRRSG